MKRILEYTISPEESGLSILDYLKQKNYTTSVIRHLKETPDGILQNGTWARVRDILYSPDLLTVLILDEVSSSNIVPSPLPFPLVYEDEDLMIINKPAGMPVHPSQGNFDNTLANAAASYFQSKNEPYVFRCINRLDRDTSGLLVLAKHIYSASLLSLAMAKREIHREYRAVVSGTLLDSGTITAPIGRVTGSTIERCIDPEHGEYACTHYRKIDSKNGYSLVSLSLDTGRTHQIRVHMRHIGFPLPGDFLYNPDYSAIGRQALHSYRLTFLHPITKVPLDFKQKIPEDMRLLFKD